MSDDLSDVGTTDGPISDPHRAELLFASKTKREVYMSFNREFGWYYASFVDVESVVVPVAGQQKLFAMHNVKACGSKWGDELWRDVYQRRLEKEELIDPIMNTSLCDCVGMPKLTEPTQGEDDRTVVDLVFRRQPMMLTMQLTVMDIGMKYGDNKALSLVFRVLTAESKAYDPEMFENKVAPFLFVKEPSAREKSQENIDQLSKLMGIQQAGVGLSAATVVGAVGLGGLAGAAGFGGPPRTSADPALLGALGAGVVKKKPPGSK